ncbi:hypothetical protein C9374_011994 [Naegleria lovaniensis]|uniref:Ribosomal protein L15 n=1 Tax=Naegleria lovaniensis TaxID=51637 RepID=A0AA88GGB4_NAELO|nr:uncharacterized protein C9374_011994 [Naegleria lovaniensis]KAG2373531.1 hypothetical protein C9374_011994 [Naegleria lovaniensis]
MGAYKYLNALYKKKQSDALRYLLRIRSWELRQLPGIHRVNHPTRPDKAHQLGFKAKQGYVIYRVRIRRGGRKKQVPGGRVNGKPATQGIHLKPKRNLQVVAEGRVGKRVGALRVLNSYWVNQDGRYKWYEVICVDPTSESVRVDPQINWITTTKHKHREMRGLTSSGKRHRGLRTKGCTSSKVRPSRRGSWKRRNTTKLQRKR